MIVTPTKEHQTLLLFNIFEILNKMKICTVFFSKTGETGDINRVQIMGKRPIITISFKTLCKPNIEVNYLLTCFQTTLQLWTK